MRAASLAVFVILAPSARIAAAQLSEQHRSGLRACASLFDAGVWQKRSTGAYQRLQGDLQPIRLSLDTLRGALAEGRGLGAAAGLDAVGSALTWLSSGFDSWNYAMTGALLVRLDQARRDLRQPLLMDALRELAASDGSPPEFDRVAVVVSDYTLMLRRLPIERPPLGGLNHAPTVVRRSLESAGTYLSLLRSVATPASPLQAAAARPGKPDGRWSSSNVTELIGLFRELEEAAAVNAMMLDQRCNGRRREAPDPRACQRLPGTLQAVELVRQHVAWLESIPSHLRTQHAEAATRSEHVRREFRALIGAADR